MLATHFVLAYGNDCDGCQVRSITPCASKEEADKNADEQASWSDGEQYHVTDSWEEVVIYCQEHDLTAEAYRETYD